jgi:hypothetical protein
MEIGSKRRVGRLTLEKFRNPVILEGMLEDCCPRCGSEDVALGATWQRHALRAVVGTSRRFCRGCGLRWLDEFRTYSPMARLAAVCAASALIFGGVALSKVVVPSAPSNRVLASVVPGSRAAGDGRLLRAAGGGGLSPASGALSYSDGGSAGLAGVVDAGFMDSSGRPMRPGQSLTEDGSAGYPAPVAYNNVQSDDGSGKALGQLSTLLKLAGGKVDRTKLDQIDRMDKKQLWDQYGSYFGSKEEAKAAYNQYQQNKGRIRAELDSK